MVVSTMRRKMQIWKIKETFPFNRKLCQSKSKSLWTMATWRCWFEYIWLDSRISLRSIWNLVWRHHAGSWLEWITTCISIRASIKFNFTIFRSLSARYITANSFLFITSFYNRYFERYSSSIFIRMCISSPSTSSGTVVPFPCYKLLRRVTVGCNDVSRTRNIRTSITRCKRSPSECILPTQSIVWRILA